MITSSGMCRLAAAVLFLGLGAISSGLRAQEPEGFRIESIMVEGGRRASTQEIVIEESRLTTGRAWNERELREAIYRIRRLPFIVRADFEVRRGSERGLYALVITVEETRPFFFAQDLELFAVSPETVSFALGYNQGGIEASNSGTAAARLFVGARTAAFAAIDGNEGIQAGIARYGLFGRGGSAAATWSRSVCCRREVLPLGLDPGLVIWDTTEANHATLSIEVPLAGNQSLRSSVSWLRGSAGSRRGLLDQSSQFQYFGPDGDDLQRWTSEVKWFYDTADDPLFPTHGVTISGGLELSRMTGPAREGSEPGLDPSRRDFDARLVTLAGTGGRTWSVSPRQAISLGGRVAVGRSRIENLVRNGHVVEGTVDLDSVETSLVARYSASLWGFERTRDQGDLRFETFARYGWDTTSPSFGGALRQFSIGSSLAFRNSWGVFRFGLNYIDLQRPRR